MPDDLNYLSTRANLYADRNNIENPTIIINSAKRTVSITGESDGARISTEITLFENGDYVKNSSKFQVKQRKSDYIDEVVQLKSMGYTQIEIATKLGISQSTVSNLLRSAKNIF